MNLLLNMMLFLTLAFPQFNIPQHTGATAAAAASPNWAFVQSAFDFSCASGTSCTISGLASTTAGSVMVVGLAGTGGVSGVKFTSGSGGGGTWQLCASSGCFQNAFGDSQDIIYNITGTGGATSVTISYNTTISAVLALGEWKCTANCGTIAVDQLVTAPVQSASCSTCTAAAYTGLTGTSDLMVQLVGIANNPATPSAPYQLDSNLVWIYALNNSSGTAPTVCNSSSSSSCVADAGSFAATGLAFK